MFIGRTMRTYLGDEGQGQPIFTVVSVGSGVQLADDESGTNARAVSQWSQVPGGGCVRSTGGTAGTVRCQATEGPYDSSRSIPSSWTWVDNGLGFPQP